MSRYFPDPDSELYEDVVAMGLPLKTEILVEAYSKGIFPWPHDDLPLLWCCPVQRGILEFESLHLPKSFKKFLRQTKFKIQFNAHFSEVIEACSKVPRPGQSGTWIDQNIIKAYVELNKLGYAHSVEVLDGDQLVGGLYGVYTGGVFAGESMFFREDNASKLALYACVKQLIRMGHKWMDIQMLTPITEQFGGVYVTRKLFLQKLKKESGHSLKSSGTDSKSGLSTNHILFPQGEPFSAS